MQDVKINYNGQEYTLKYNRENGYYEIELEAPKVGGIYPIEIEYTDLLNKKYSDSTVVQVFQKTKAKLAQEKVFMWIFDYDTFKVKDIVEILSDYEIIIDEETNAKSIINVLKKTTAKARDIVAIKKNNEVIYWGIVSEIHNDNGSSKYEYSLKYITNLFDRDIKLENESLIKTEGLEKFIENAILTNFTNSEDTFINLDYLKLKIKSQTIKKTSVTNVENGIYNLHTWITNCTQNYDIVYEFGIENKQFVMSIENKNEKKQLIDTNAMAVSNYNEVFETDFVSKVTVLTSSNPLTLFLLNDRTTTTDAFNSNRANGKITTIYTENYEDAMEAALNVMKANSYNHNISFNLLEKYIKIGTPIAIKTKKSIIYDTYISSVKFTSKKSIGYQCGNIRINYLEKVLQERRK